MKKNIFKTMLFIGMGILLMQCTQKTSSESTPEKSITGVSSQNVAVQAIYFHATRRCATCEAVEAVTKDALNEYYSGTVAFTSINREEDNENPMIEKYKVSGQTLLIIKGDKVVNLTNDAFMNARTNPDKLKAKIKATVDSML